MGNLFSPTFVELGPNFQKVPQGLYSPVPEIKKVAMAAKNVSKVTTGKLGRKGHGWNV